VVASIRCAALLAAHQADDRLLGGVVRIVDGGFHDEAVHLRLGQRVGAFLLDGVLCCQHHEQAWQGVAVAGDGDRALLHGLEQCRLHLRRRAVDLVREHHVVEDRSRLEAQLLFAVDFLVDLRARDVRRQQVRRELDAPERRISTRARVRTERVLAVPGSPLEQARCRW
jgi:hypothetical protein